jgi:hypothetical protein
MITAAVETITPNVAQSYLGTMASNRTLSVKRVDKYAHLMATDQWQLNGQTIVFEAGRLIDGQHRLRAVIKAGIAVAFLVVRGADSDSFETIDTGASRTLAHALSVEGIPSVHWVASAVRWISRWERGVINGPDITLTNREGLELIRRHPAILDSIRFVERFRMPGVCTVSIRGFAHYVWSHADRDMADFVVERLATLHMLHQDDPIARGRARLEKLAREFPGSGGRNKARTQLEILFRTWQAHLTGRRLKMLKVYGEVPDIGINAHPSPSPTTKEE